MFPGAQSIQNDESWMLRVGDEYDNSEEIADALLVDIDEIGPIYLTDVADITVIDNAMDAYARLNGQPAVMLSIFKNSSTGTNELSRIRPPRRAGPVSIRRRPAAECQGAPAPCPSDH